MTGQRWYDGTGENITPEPMFFAKLVLDKDYSKLKEKFENIEARINAATKANVMCLDVQAGEPCNKVVTVPRTYKDDEALMKKVRPLLETDTFKAVHIVDKEEIETLYGMTEQEFIQYAKVLPPRNGANSDEEADNE